LTGNEYLRSFHELKAIVIGDLMLDEYVFGRATRISQEAPVLVVKQQRVSAVPGGAANVAMNIMALGASVGILGVVGADLAGQNLEDSLVFSGIEKLAILKDPTRPTTRKTRVVANHSHQVLRIDHETEEPISSALEEQLIDALDKACEGRDVILVSDYQKGVVVGSTIEKIVALGKKHGLAVVANAKPESAKYYKGATAVSLNRFEASTAIGRMKPIEDSEAEDVVRKLQNELDIDTMIVTLGSSGMVATSKSETSKVPAVKVEVYDEAGAGDTVIATIALCSCQGPIDRSALELATFTAAAVVRKVGVAVPSDEDLRSIAEILR